MSRQARPASPASTSLSKQFAKNDSWMMQRPPKFRPATIDDANVLAELINYAGEGMPVEPNG